MIDNVRGHRPRQNGYQYHGPQEPPARQGQQDRSNQLAGTDDDREPGGIAPGHKLYKVRWPPKDPDWRELERREEEEFDSDEPAQARRQPSRPEASLLYLCLHDDSRFLRNGSSSSRFRSRRFRS